MAGKRIRCRQCGGVFTVPQAQGAPEDEESSALNSLAEMERSQAGESMLHASGSFAGEEEGPQDVPEGGTAGRRNVRFTYPYAVVVDRWLPVILLVGGVVWITLTAIHQSPSPGLGLARAGVLLLCYLVLICPLALKGVEMAGRDIGFHMPRGKRVRALASFMPAFAIGAVLWTISHGTGAMVVGLLVGLIVTAGPLLVLFRLRPRELPAAAGYAGGMMAFGVALAWGILFGLNALLSSALVSMHKNEALSESPFGAAFTWPKPEAPKTILAKKAKPAPSPSPSPTPSPAPSDQTTSKPPETTHEPEASASESEPIKFFGQNADPSKTNVESIPPETQATNTTPEPEKTEPPKPLPAAVVAPVTDSPFVDGPLVMAAMDTHFDTLIAPLTSSQWLAVLRRDGERGTIERIWAGTGDAPTAIAAAAHVPAIKPWAGVGTAAPYVKDSRVKEEKYVLSPDGELLAHVASFPSLSISVYSFLQKRARPIPLDRADASAVVYGFINNDRLLVHRTFGNECGFELWDPRSGKVVKPAFRTVPFDPKTNSVAISPDGTTLAIASRDTQQGNSNSNPHMLFFYDLTNSSQRKLPIPNLDPTHQVSPTGITFSPDGKKIAVLFEEAGNGLLVVFRTKNQLKPIYAVPLQPMPVMPPRAYEGSSLIWLSDDALLLYGRKIMTPDGTEAGDLGVPDVAFARLIAPNLCELGLLPASGEKQIALAKLKLDQIPKPTK